jgi:hypothetical protein
MDSALVFGRASSLEVGTAAFTLLHGIAFFTAGIGELARIKTNRADLRSGRQ